MTIQAALKAFWRQEEGQDLIEYTLLIAFVTFTSASLFILSSGHLDGIWTVSNSRLAAGQTTAS